MLQLRVAVVVGYKVGEMLHLLSSVATIFLATVADVFVLVYQAEEDLYHMVHVLLHSGDWLTMVKQWLAEERRLELATS